MKNTLYIFAIIASFAMCGCNREEPLREEKKVLHRKTVNEVKEVKKRPPCKVVFVTREKDESRIENKESKTERKITPKAEERDSSSESMKELKSLLEYQKASEYLEKNYPELNQSDMIEVGNEIIVEISEDESNLKEVGDKYIDLIHRAVEIIKGGSYDLETQCELLRHMITTIYRLYVDRTEIESHLRNECRWIEAFIRRIS